MNDEREELTEDLLCTPFGFRVYWNYSEYWADVTVWEIAGRECGESNAPLFQRKHAMVSPDFVPTHEEAERYLEGFIKWDGCSEFTFSPDDDVGNHFHWCGPSDYRKHFAILEALYRRAQQLMVRGNWEPWDRDPVQSSASEI